MQATVYYSRPDLVPQPRYINILFNPKILRGLQSVFFKEHEKKNSADSFQFVSPACTVADWEWRVAEDDKNVSCSNARISRGLHDRNPPTRLFRKIRFLIVFQCVAVCVFTCSFINALVVV
jgi:hypothetical protein